MPVLRNGIPDRARTCDLRFRKPSNVPPNSQSEQKFGQAKNPCGHQCGHAGVPSDTELEQVVLGWSRLPPAIKRGILAMVESVVGPPPQPPGK